MLIYMTMMDSEEESKFEIIYKKYKGLMFWNANNILNNAEDAEDAVHQAFVKIAKNIRAIDEPVSPRTERFVITIVKNTAIDIYRRAKKRKTIGYAEVEQKVSISHENIDRLTRCILMLPENYQKLMLMKYYYGYDMKESAKILGVSEANVYKLYQKAKEELFQLCKEEGLL